ncbi:low temperature requirement protein LtrA [Saccharopolyspora erythraea NRRL 2338]|uniref:Low temperature requirement A n=2 Tax=Saccharopolyspora erythraea TaxID=1836 RepID=A4FAY6_SACEN|nr:low temperature requirement protein A [Saccharopolyspora erythraea]EQD87593.1 membrane protein [Saccharopolyspora erythraea D]PFG94995.1 low temperature requirement protein LtrA [Saccharopolyspora erythraea NRRL 2338]QRK91684.1 low temperature requirement protein A [Saccharopolyspora erythraea]CAM01211.1 low temperature requirement A [Saccharopolyspora erythraea NRRL 2338]
MAEVPPLRTRMLARDPSAQHRAATPLELLFDLCFVAAVGQAAAQLHHGVSEGHTAGTLLGYLMVFFAIWWAWMNFTWFASAYDTDDVPYRALTLVQMAGVLVLAAGVPAAFRDYDFTIATIGYVVMRVALVAQWLRAAREHPEGRPCTLRYAVGIGLCQVAWIGRLWLPHPWGEIGFAVLAVAEMLVPVIAERRMQTAWHPRHIAERYGLFTIIVLGEVVLAVTAGIQEDVADGGWSAGLLEIGTGGLLMIFAMWWIYFKHTVSDHLRDSLTRAIAWGYGHYLVFGGIAAVGAGLEVVIDSHAHKAHLGAAGAALSVAVPLLVYLVVLSVLHVQLVHAGGLMVLATIVGGALLLSTAGMADTLTVEFATLLMGVEMMLVLVAGLVIQHTEPRARELADRRL